MKIKYILPLLAVSLIAACGYNQLAGSNFDTYVQTYGVPTSEYALQNGNKLYFYKKHCKDSKGWQEYNVEVTPENTIVKRTYIKSCPIVTDNKNNETTCKKGKCVLKLIDDLAEIED